VEFLPDSGHAVVLDWFSRRVLSWRLSITMEANTKRPHQSLDGATPDQAYFTELPLRAAA
jgi:transposase InsO family protein